MKDINYIFKNEFVDFCKKEFYALGRIQRAFVWIKTFCKHAKFVSIKTHHQLDCLNIKRPEKTEKIYLTFEELTKIESISKR